MIWVMYLYNVISNRKLACMHSLYSVHKVNAQGEVTFVFLHVSSL